MRSKPIKFRIFRIVLVRMAGLVILSILPLALFTNGHEAWAVVAFILFLFYFVFMAATKYDELEAKLQNPAVAIDPAAIEILHPVIMLNTAQLIANELHRAKTKFPDNFKNHHEAYAVLLEEVDEYWEVVKRTQPNNVDHVNLQCEAVQVAAMAIRIIQELPAE